MFYSSQGNEKPTIQELSQFVIHQYAAHWKDLGALLGLKDNEIANIASDYRNQCVDACRGNADVVATKYCLTNMG